MAKISDEEIKKKWNEACRHYYGFGYRVPGHKPGGLGKRLADIVIDELEKAGVTEEDIDRLFPEDKIARDLVILNKQNMIAEYGPYVPSQEN
jgi:hypothetical protein